MSKHPVKKVAVILLVSVITLELIFGLLYFNKGSRIGYHGFITGLMILYHILMRAITPRVLAAVHKKPYNCDNWMFRSRSFEKKLYKAFRVKKWKDSLITVDPETFSPKTNSLENIIDVMCMAELLHLLLFFFSLLFILFGLVFGHLWVFAVVGIISACLEVRFIMAQRYNRPRVIAFMNRRK